MSYAWFHLKFIEPLDLSPSSLLLLLLLSPPQLYCRWLLSFYRFVSISFYIFFDSLCLRNQHTKHIYILSATHLYTCSASNADILSVILFLLLDWSRTTTKIMNCLNTRNEMNKQKSNKKEELTNRTLLIRNRIAFENYWFYSLLFFCLVGSLLHFVLYIQTNECYCEKNYSVEWQFMVCDQ